MNRNIPVSRYELLSNNTTAPTLQVFAGPVT